MKNCKRLFHDAVLLLTGAALSFGWWIYMLNRPARHAIKLREDDAGRDAH